MFDKGKYVTSGVDSVVPPFLQYFMWNAIETMNVPEKDYLQIFKLSKSRESGVISESLSCNSDSDNSLIDNLTGAVSTCDTLVCSQSVSSNPTSNDSTNIEFIVNNSLSGQSVQHIIHSQEQPPYSMKYTLVGKSTPIDAKIYVIDDHTHSTMLLTEEY